MEIKKPNIFIKSSYRQPIITLLLSIVVGVAAFFIVLRVVEYRTISHAITEAESNYRAIGFLSHPDPSFANVYYGAEVVIQSDFVAYDHPTPVLSGVLQGDVLNANNWPFGMFGHLPFPRRAADYAIFVGTVQNIAPRTDFTVGDFITVVVDEVLGGFPEYVPLGQHITLRVPRGVLQYLDLQEGGRYILRGHNADLTGTNSPTSRGDLVIRTLEPLNAFTNSYGAIPLRPGGRSTEVFEFTNSDGFIWYIETHENADIPDCDWLMRELSYIEIGTHSLSVYFTTDLTISASFHVLWRYFEDGRAITREDYLKRNHVAVVYTDFLRYNELEIGDYITIDLVDAFFITTQMPIDYEVLTNAATQTLTLEIVGTYTAFNNVTRQTTDIIFVPQSLLPRDFNPHIPSSTYYYSFILTSARHEDAFLTEIRPQLNALGFDVSIDTTPGASEFFAAADPIMQSLTVNFFVFVGVSLAIFALCVFIYLRQTKKNFTILRYLGVPKRSAALQRFSALLIFWLPAMVVGGVLGYFNALSQIALTLGELGL